MGSSPFQALELEKTIIVQWLNPNFDGFELVLGQKHVLKGGVPLILREATNAKYISS